MIVKLTHPGTGLFRIVKVGWSWTVFLFGPIALAIRGQWMHAFVYIGICLITAGLAAPILWFVYGSIANKILAQNLMMKNGLRFDEDNDADVVRQASMRWQIRLPDAFSIQSQS